MPAPSPPPAPRTLAALAGIAAAAVALGVDSLAAALLAPTSSAFLALGGAVVDLTPAWLKDAAIAAFGTADKVALGVVMLVVVAALAALAGIVAARNRPAGAALVVVLSAVTGSAALLRPGAGPAALLPSALGAVAGVATLWALVARLPSRPSDGTPGPDDGVSRRTFVALAGASLVLGTLAVLGGQVVSAARRTVEAARQALRLPAAARVAPALPSGVQVDGVGPFVTPNDSFYRIDTALTVPQVDPATWRLRVHGLVEREVEISFDELLASDLVEAWVTLTCVSNAVGGDLAGNALWLGLPVREVLARAAPLPEADMVLSTSADGFTASTPLQVLTDDRDALLAVGMNGEPLPQKHGFPVRLVVPGLYGYVSATKWVVDLEVTRFADATAYWTTRGWSERAPVKTASRIEVPRDGATVRPGRVMVGGTAWAQHRGIVDVEVTVDDGAWQRADLAAVPGVDTWRQWSFAWDAAPGRHTLQVRASDPDGPQTGEVAPPAPDGATGWHTVTVTVGA